MDHLLVVCSHFHDYTVTLTQYLPSDSIDGTGESSNPAVTPSGGTEQDETYLPSRGSPFLESKDYRNTRPTRNRTARTIDVGSREMARDTDGHEQADEAPRVPVSMTAASSQPTQENDSTSDLTDTVTFRDIRRTLYFRSVERKAQALDAAANGIATTYQTDIDEMKERNDSHDAAMGLFYLDCVFPHFRTTLLENGGQLHQDNTHPSIMEYNGETIYFNSVEEKAQALDTAMVNLESQIDSYLDRIKETKRPATFYSLSDYRKLTYLPRREKLLLENGASMRPSTHIANSRD